MFFLSSSGGSYVHRYKTDAPVDEAVGAAATVPLVNYSLGIDICIHEIPSV
jgi:hypothetical protein